MSLALIATGGTIAGTGAQDSYTAATLGAEALLGAAARLRELADWHIEQPFALDSRDIEPAHWLQLATRVQAQIDDPAIDGIRLTLIDRAPGLLASGIVTSTLRAAPAAVEPDTPMSRRAPNGFNGMVTAIASPAVADVAVPVSVAEPGVVAVKGHSVRASPPFGTDTVCGAAFVALSPVAVIDTAIGSAPPSW